MAFIIGTATQEADLYRVFRDFVTGKGRPGQVNYTGVGNGKLNNLLYPEGSALLYDTLTLTCVSTAVRGGEFSVEGAAAGVLPDARVGTTYKQAGVEFYLDFGPIDFELGDQFVITACGKPTGKPGFAYIRPGLNAKTEIITLTCTVGGVPQVEGSTSNMPASFSVSGSVSGALPALTQGVAYTSSIVNALLAANQAGANQYVEGDILTLRTTSNPLREINQHWEILRQTPATGADLKQFGRDTPDVDTELFLRGPGLAGDDDIYWGMLRRHNDTAASAQWVHVATTGHLPNLTMQDQPVTAGRAGERPSHHMWSLQIPYVIIASGRCVKILTRSNTYYSQSYFGLFLASTQPKYLGYPAFIGGSGVGSDNPSTAVASWSDTTSIRAAFWDFKGATNASSSAYVMGEDNKWAPVYGSGSDSALRAADTRTDPYNNGGMYDLRNNLDGSIPAFQVHISPNRGFLDGVYAIPGRDGRQPEDIIVMQDGRRLFVVQNVYRASFADFCGFALE